MRNVKVYAKFLKKDDIVFRTSTHIQFGDSDKVIGACVLCNPTIGKAVNISSVQQELYDEGSEISGELNIEGSFELLVKIIYKLTNNNPEGKFYIYNLFNLVSTSITKSVQNLNINKYEKFLFRDFEDFKITTDKIPWLLVAWGCQDNKELNAEKKKWLKFIASRKIKNFGIKGKKEYQYKHPMQKNIDDRMKYRLDISDEYDKVIKKSFLKEHKFGLVRFPISATKPNILVDRNYNESFQTQLDYDTTWTLDQITPMNIISGYSNIRLKRGYKLIGYAYNDGTTGAGVVWALPNEVKATSPSECNLINTSQGLVPQPREGIEDFMEVIEGDMSPLSYLQAAILYKEIDDFASFWKEDSWKKKSILPIDSTHKLISYSKELENSIDKKEIIQPHFYFNRDDNPIIEFNTISDNKKILFHKYKFIFNKNGYSFKLQKTLIKEVSKIKNIAFIDRINNDRYY